MVTHKAEKAVTPRFYAPMLATLVKEPFSDPNWVFEKKFDGERCIVVKRGKQVTLYSRNRKKLNLFYPELVTALRKQRKDFVVDGEIVAKSFASLQTRMQRKAPGNKVPVTLFLFDALNVAGIDLRREPLLERKKALKRAISFGGKIRYVSHVKKNGIAAFKKAEEKKWEGIIAKDTSAKYVSKRTKSWQKFKCAQKGKFVIAGFTAPKGSRIGIGALILGHKRDGKLRYAGKVGTGFNTEMLRRLSDKLKRIERERSPFSKGSLKGVHFVSPKYFCIVAFTEWTNDGKLRHPRFLREC